MTFRKFTSIRSKTPVPLELISENFNEEIADVMVCVDALIQAGVASNEEIAKVMEKKDGRWAERVRKKEPKKTISCPRCLGSGRMKIVGLGPVTMQTCSKCNGTGEVEENE